MSDRFPRFEFNADEWRMSRHVRALSLADRGRLIERILDACENNDTAFLATCSALVRRVRFRRSAKHRDHIPFAIQRFVRERDGGCCRHCGSDRDLQLDHVVAVVHGGTDAADNLQLLCGPCNRKKGPLPWERRRNVS